LFLLASLANPTPSPHALRSLCSHFLHALNSKAANSLYRYSQFSKESALGNVQAFSSCLKRPLEVYKMGDSCLDQLSIVADLQQRGPGHLLGLEKKQGEEKVARQAKAKKGPL